MERSNVCESRSILQKFKQVLALDEKETGSLTFVHQFKDKSGTNIVTRLENVLINRGIETQSLQPYLNRSQMTQIFLHATEQSSLGYKKLFIVTADVNVIFIVLYLYWNLDISEV